MIANIRVRQSVETIYSEEAYTAFIDRIIAAAKEAEFRPAPAGDERLRGPRQ
jgi:hypothetical protein